jgi:hypothetical protein
MALKEALETIVDHYGVETDGKTVVTLTPFNAPFPPKVWEAWKVIAKKIKRI